MHGTNREISTPGTSQGTSLKVVFLVGSDTSSTRSCIERVYTCQDVRPLAVLMDTGKPSRKRRIQNLLRNVRTNGLGYIPHRILEALRNWAESASFQAVISPQQISTVLKNAFPNRSFSLEELGQKYGFSVHKVGNLNSAEAISKLRELNADLGVVLGTRVLRPSVFQIPRLGCINLHKGKVPEYRGQPPGFWELYNGASSAGVTVHFVDEHLDTGDIVASSEIPIWPTETPVSLLEKLNLEGQRVLVEAVSAIQRSQASGDPLPRRPQPVSPGAATRTRPTLREIATLRAKCPHWKREHPFYTVMKVVYGLLLYRTGLYTLARWANRRDPHRSAILLYHRVNDYSKDPLTVDTETFAAQLLAISKHYSLSSTAAIVDAIRAKRPAGPNGAVAIHFDDCYQDVLTNGAPVLAAVGSTAAAFISTGFIDTERTFEHDRQKYPFQFPMFRSAEIQEWVQRGFEAGAHTINHVNLGTCPPDRIHAEIVECGQHLKQLLGQDITLFSFPFGRIDNIRGEAVEIIRNSYSALFSAHGGFIGRDTDVYDIPRMGVSYEASPLYLLLQLEGLAPSQIAQRFRGR